MKSIEAVFKGESKEIRYLAGEFDQLIHKITYRKKDEKPLTPHQTAELMFDLFEKVVNKTEANNADELKKNLKTLCEVLIKKDKMNFVVRNCSERLLHLFTKLCNELKIELKGHSNVSYIQSLKQLNQKRTLHQHDD